MGGGTSHPFAGLERQSYISLTTYRKNGEGVSTPVWFAEINGKLYVYTGSTAGKVKRIVNNPRVSLAPCTFRGVVTGETIEAKARVLETAIERRAADAALNRKYGLTKRVLNFIGRLRGEQDSDTAFIEIWV